jgi:hypothetical protein
MFNEDDLEVSYLDEEGDEVKIKSQNDLDYGFNVSKRLISFKLNE